MTGDDLLFLASNLVANASLGNPASRYRSAVTRTYYGAFHIIVAFLEELGTLAQLAGIDRHVPEESSSSPAQCESREFIMRDQRAARLC